MAKPAKQPSDSQEQTGRHYYPTAKQAIALECTCQTVLFGGARGGGKGNPYSENIVTPYGMRKMGDLKEGDIITGSDGSPQKIIQIFELGERDIYRVDFIDGSSCRCTSDHIWKIKKTCTRSKKRRGNLIPETQEFDWHLETFDKIKEWLDKKEAAPERALIKKQNLLIPLAEPIKFTKSYRSDMRPIDPYILGLLLGDGGLTGCGIIITSADSEIIDEIEKAYRVKRRDKYNYAVLGRKISQDLRKLKLKGCGSPEKFIPDSYKLSTIETRMSLIQGLMDTDGYADNRGHVIFSTVSERLAKDVQWIIWSLGGKATITKSPAGYKNQDGEYINCLDCFDVYINTSFNRELFRLERKKSRCKDDFNGGVGYLHRRITGYEYVGREKARCIMVSNPDALYLCGDFILTHNTECCRFKILQHVEQYKENARILFLRRSLRELEQIIDRCKIMYAGIADWKEQKKRFEFKNGAICEFNYLEGESVHNYQGSEFTLIILDEVGQFDSYDDIKLLKACLRSATGVPCQLFMTANPGGRLHNILKAEFIDPAPKGMVPIEDTEPDGTPMGTYRVYIPAWLSENPYLLESDPTYIQRLKQTGSAEMVRAWLKGDWDIISGGAFDKLWDRDIHVIRPFRIPRNWRIVECYDDGMTKPAATVWFAISDGSDYYLPNGERRSTIRGDVFVIAERYFWNGKPNEGSAESTPSKAGKIKLKEKMLGYEISQRIADSAIFSSKTRSIADEFAENGVAFDRCNKAPGSRLIAANLFRNALMGSLVRMEKPGIFFFSTCIHCIRTIPTLPRDKKTPDDVDSSAEDHVYDCICYLYLSDYDAEVQVFSAGNC